MDDETKLTTRRPPTKVERSTLDNKYVTLTECVYELIRVADPSAGAALISLLKNRRDSWSIYADSHDCIKKVYGNKAALYIQALRAEDEAEKLLCARLKTGRIRGRGTDKAGCRYEIDQEDWFACHINIQKSALLAPLSLSNYRSLWTVQIRLYDVLYLFESDKLTSAHSIRAAPRTEQIVRRRSGRPPTADPDAVQAMVFQLMDHHGDFAADDQEWGAQARLEEAVEDAFGISESRARALIAEPLEAWRRRKVGL